MTTTMSSAQEVVEEKKEWWARRRETVAAVARHMDINQSQLAEALGLHRQSMAQRMKGAAKIEPWELGGIAHVFGIPEYVLWYEPTQAIRWILDNPEQVNPPKGPGPGIRSDSRCSGFDREWGVDLGANRLQLVDKWPSRELQAGGPFPRLGLRCITLPTDELQVA